MPITQSTPTALVAAEVRMHNGRPMLFLDGAPHTLSAYSPPLGGSWVWPDWQRSMPHFLERRMGAYFLFVPSGVGDDFFRTPFWDGDHIGSTPSSELEHSLNAQAAFILQGDPDAHFIVRLAPHEPPNWRDLHPDQLFVNEEGETLAVPSLASQLYWDAAADFCRAIIEHCEAQSWGGRVIGYAEYQRMEGTHEPVVFGWLFDHSRLMTARWREYLQNKYRTLEALRAAHGDAELTFENAAVPKDLLRGSTPSVASALYWQGAEDNAPLRDYLLLQRDLYHDGFRRACAAMQQTLERLGRRRFLIHDALKQPMMGWNNRAFFDENFSQPLAFPEDRAASGHLGVAPLFDAPGMDGLITPHDYQARGVGGVYQQEGSADSMTLRGKLFFSEMDTRTYADLRDPHYGLARDIKEFEALTWRNISSSLMHGHACYYMDLWSDWFSRPEMKPILDRQTAVLREALDWPHQAVPGIAMILDDEAILETSGNGAIMNEHIMWEQKMGIARCGVPYSTYVFDDLKLDNFPDHRVYYFPNLYRVDEERLAVLRERVFRDGHVVLWGPGSGISDGSKIGPDSASRLTGFEFDYLAVNYPRRTLISDFSHPITQELKADTILGGPLAYGPVLFPRDGQSLGLAWTKQGRNYSGLAVKDFETSAGRWHSVFTTATPLPADLWRGLARFGGAHVYCQSNDVLMADRSIVALHSIQSGAKRIALPREYSVQDLISGEELGCRRHIEFQLDAPQTRVFLLQNAGG